jgi:ubiquinone biosynthesis UbiH/UbiF/VisC/COQ6 family hydroxylase
MEVHGDEGGELYFRAQDQGVPGLAWIVDVQALLERLGEALRYQAQVEWLDAPQPAALTVVCEGRASSTRAEYGVAFEVTPYPQHAIAARLECEKPHDRVARQWFSNGEILALLPLGGHSVALVWSVAESRAPGLLSLDGEAFAAQVARACQGALGSMKLSSARAEWPLQLARAHRWCGEGWVLAGDAAHTVHPLAGQGLNLGLADAGELARILHEREYWRSVGDLRLLRRYERSRKADVVAMGAVTDGLQQLFAREGDPWESLRNWGMTGVDRSGPVKDWLARQAMGRA